TLCTSLLQPLYSYSCYRTSRDLHSFPTRRSSDLLDIFTGPTADNTDATGTAGGSAHGARVWGQAGSTGGAPIMCYLPHNSKTFTDRKSTRLNSSHGSISYAVFCLKKKKPNDNTDH